MLEPKRISQITHQKNGQTIGIEEETQRDHKDMRSF